MKLAALFLTLLISVHAMAMPCGETKESTAAIIANMKKITEMDQQVETEFNAAVKQLQSVTKMSSQKLSAYAAKLVTNENVLALQQQRQELGMKTMRLMAGTDCAALKETQQQLREVVALQWLSVNTQVKADTQVYLAKRLAETAKD